MKKLLFLLIFLPKASCAMEKTAMQPLEQETSTQPSAPIDIALRDTLRQQIGAFSSAFSIAQLTFAACKKDNEFVKFSIAPSILFTLATLLEIQQKTLFKDGAVRQLIAAVFLVATLAAIPPLVEGAFVDTELTFYGFSALGLGALASAISYFKIESINPSGLSELLSSLILPAIAGLSVGNLTFASFKHDHEMRFYALIPLILSAVGSISVLIKLIPPLFLLTQIISAAISCVITIVTGCLSLVGIIAPDKEIIIYSITALGLAILATVTSTINVVKNTSRARYAAID